MMDGDGDAQLRVATCVAQHQHRIMHATAPFQFIMQRQQLSLLIGAVQWRASGQRTAMMGVRAASDKKALELSVPPSLQPPFLCFSFGCSGYFSIFSGFSFAIGEVCPGPPIPPTGRAKLLQVPLPVPCYFFSSFVPS